MVSSIACNYDQSRCTFHLASEKTQKHGPNWLFQILCFQSIILLFELMVQFTSESRIFKLTVSQVNKIDPIKFQSVVRVRIHVRRMQCPLFPKMYFKPLKKKVRTAFFSKLLPSPSGLGSKFLTANISTFASVDTNRLS